MAGFWPLSVNFVAWLLLCVSSTQGYQNKEHLVRLHTGFGSRIIDALGSILPDDTEEAGTVAYESENLWPRAGHGMLCESRPFVYVTSQAECQMHAKNYSDKFYAHRSDTIPGRCITFKACKKPLTDKSSAWKLYRHPEDFGHCEDTWLPKWAKSPKHACTEWARNSQWGALKGKSTLRASCEGQWASIQCAKTCGCLVHRDDGEGESPGETSGDFSGEHAGKSADESSDNSSGKSADESSDKSPGESSDESSDKSPGESSDESSDKSPGESSDESSDKSSGESADESSDKSPGKSADESSDKSPGESSDESSDKSSGASSLADTDASVKSAQRQSSFVWVPAEAKGTACGASDWEPASLDECQAKAEERGHSYFSFDDEQDRCITATECSDAAPADSSAWQVYHLEAQSSE